MSDIPPPPPLGAEAYQGGGSGPQNENDKLMAAVAHAAPILDFGSGVLGAVIILVWFFGFKDKTTPFIEQHLKQSIYFLIGSWVLYVAGFIIFAVTCIGGVLLFPIMLFVLVMRVMAAIKAFAGEQYQYPMVGNWTFLG